MVKSRVLSLIRSTFSLRDTILLAIVSCSFVVVIIGLLLSLVSGFEEVGFLLGNRAQTVAAWTGLILLILNGTTIKTTYWKFIVASLFIIVLAQIFIILHLPIGYELLLAGFILLEIVYTIRFITRNPTGVLDWFKYIWICSWCVITLFILFKRLSHTYALIPSILFWMTILLFLLTKMKIIGEGKGNY